jgi:hypothetical protein
MRLYTKINSLGTGITASKKNKGILLINPTITGNAPFTIDIINVDDTVTALGLTLNSVNASALSLSNNPNYAIIPFTISSWTDTSATGILGYELF